VHGIFERPEPRRALITALANARGFNWSAGAHGELDPYDALADVLAETLDLRGMPALAPG
jgi:hypothetical protein